MPWSYALPIAGALLGASSSGNSSTQNQSNTSPWSAAQPWITSNLGIGQNLQSQYAANPFSQYQQQAYGNAATTNNQIRSGVNSIISQLSNMPSFDRSNPTVKPSTLDLSAITSPSNTVSSANLGFSSLPSTTSYSAAVAAQQAQQAAQAAQASSGGRGVMASNSVNAADIAAENAAQQAAQNAQDTANSDGGGDSVGHAPGEGTSSGGSDNSKGGIITQSKVVAPRNDGSPDNAYISAQTGEAVVNRKAVQKYGPDMIKQINSLRFNPKNTKAK